METSKRELVLKAFHNEETERVPVGFWFHFLSGDEFNDALERPELVEKNLAGHRKFKEAFDPDFVKIMTDGYFFLPIEIPEIERAADLRKIKKLPADSAAYQKNQELAYKVREIFGDDILLFYNFFSPLNYLLHSLGFMAGLVEAARRLNGLLEEDAESVAYALNVIADSLVELIAKVVKPKAADGIYLSVNNPNRVIPAEAYKQYIAPSEKKILNAANEAAKDNILHICGYAGNKNILSVYQDYPATVINWAVHAEGVGLKEGKAFFGGKAVIGGFENTKDGILYRGSRKEVEEYVDKLLAESGKKGIIIGADCTVPSDISIERLQWVREKAGE